ncbi:putative secreted protein [Cryptosporidium canis]|uniref:Secreted protein n=1 Tax=Cryptosporidium canis TaxID=195482 RepID=A0ABQ8P3T3_9CRYT|nr:putative secreted protein [Cryptosporidium canis]
MYFRLPAIVFFIFLPNVLSFHNGLIQLIIRTSQAYLNDEQSFTDFVSTTSNEYFPLDNPQQSLSNDQIFYSKSKSTNLEFNTHGFRVHPPREPKQAHIFSINNHDYMYREKIDLSQTHFPRAKHFNRRLPKLPYEPYQRVMTYAIEVCMIPSMWYLELIHCMYMSIAPLYSGMLMSYSLQDLVGTAIKTMGYLDESFTLENCHRSVSAITDKSISLKYEGICRRMSECLQSNQFTSEPYAHLRDEFSKRIDRVYSNLGDSQLIEKHKNYARHSLLLALSSKTINLSLVEVAVERNFLVIRAMILSLSYLVNKFIPANNDVIAERFSKITRLIGYMAFSVFKHYMRFCISSSPGIFGSKSREYRGFYELFCKEFLSVGFIDESIELLGDDINTFNDSVMPSRILDPAYIAVIPSYISGLDGPVDNSWLSFSTVTKVENIEPDVIDKKKKPRTNVYYKSAKSTSIGSTQMGNTPKTRRRGFTERLTKTFTSRKKRISGQISSRMEQND